MPPKQPLQPGESPEPDPVPKPEITPDPSPAPEEPAAPGPFPEEPAPPSDPEIPVINGIFFQSDAWEFAFPFSLS
jgi:hypothetical protein